MYFETKTRSLTKTVVWRLIAIVNSFAILVSAISTQPLYNAVLMNITGFLVYYFYERAWDKISWGKVKSKGASHE